VFTFVGGVGIGGNSRDTAVTFTPGTVRVDLRSSVATSVSAWGAVGVVCNSASAAPFSEGNVIRVMPGAAVVVRRGGGAAGSINITDASFDVVTGPVVLLDAGGTVRVSLWDSRVRACGPEGRLIANASATASTGGNAGAVALASTAVPLAASPLLTVGMDCATSTPSWTPTPEASRTSTLTMTATMATLSATSSTATSSTSLTRSPSVSLSLATLNHRKLSRHPKRGLVRCRRHRR
jgi:hypothetical protein